MLLLTQFDMNLFLLLIILAFLASFIDSVVGGGGLITLPALLFAGLSPSSAVATNKLIGSMGSLTSTVMFYRSGKINLRSAKNMIPLSFLGSLLGAWAVHILDPSLLKPIMLIALFSVAIYTVIKKDFGKIAHQHTQTKFRFIVFLLAILLVGFYDGFLGPGTGSFLIFIFLFAGYDFIHAAGHAKLLNFTSNIAALLLFISLGEVNILYGLPMGIVGVVGAICGSKFAINRGISYVKLLFIIVTFALLAKNTIDYFY